MVYTRDLKSLGLTSVRVQVPPEVRKQSENESESEHLSSVFFLHSHSVSYKIWTSFENSGGSFNLRILAPKTSIKIARYLSRL